MYNSKASDVGSTHEGFENGMFRNKTCFSIYVTCPKLSFWGICSLSWSNTWYSLDDTCRQL